MTIFAGKRTLWLHQMDQLSEKSIEEVADTAHTYAAADIVLIKAMDGQTWMSAFDTSPEAISGIAKLHEVQQRGAARGLTVIPWVVATHSEDADAHAQCGPIITVDLEPYAGFAKDMTPSDVVAYLDRLQALGVTTICVSIDARPYATGALAVPSWIDRCAAVLPQLYWTDFQQPASAVLPLLASVANYGVEQIPVLPQDGSATDLGAVWQAARTYGCPGVVLWRLGTANIPALQAFGALPLPAPKPAFDDAARWQLIKRTVGGSGPRDLAAWLAGFGEESRSTRP